MVYTCDFASKSALQVCAYLRSIDEGADGYNKAWDAWSDKQNLPVGLMVEHIDQNKVSAVACQFV